MNFIKIEIDLPDKKYEIILKIAKLKKKSIEELLIEEISNLIINVKEQLDSISLFL